MYMLGSTFALKSGQLYPVHMYAHHEEALWWIPAGQKAHVAFCGYVRTSRADQAIVVSRMHKFLHRDFRWLAVNLSRFPPRFRFENLHRDNHALLPRNILIKIGKCLSQILAGRTSSNSASATLTVRTSFDSMCLNQRSTSLSYLDLNSERCPIFAVLARIWLLRTRSAWRLILFS